MSKKDDYRYKIDSLIKIANITSDEILREECCASAKNMLDKIEESADCVQMFLNKYFVVGDGRTKRTSVFELYNNVRTENDFPYLTKRQLYGRIVGLGVGEIKTNGYHTFVMKRKES